MNHRPSHYKCDALPLCYSGHNGYKDIYLLGIIMEPTKIKPEEFHYVVKKLREFFEKKGWAEVHTQSRLSILAACEDPTTISTFNYAGQVWPLPQTGQMWLEYELLKNPKCPGYFCLSTSFRNEPNPIPGRHDKIFPMFEFECKGGIEELIKLEGELLEYLGFGDRDSFSERKISGYDGEISGCTIRT